MRIRRLAFLIALLAAFTPALLAADERVTAAAGFPATFIEPVAEAPVVLFIAGSGPTDRDGNNPLGVRGSYLARLAAELARQGIGSLRYDKRGVSGSVAVGNEADVTFATYVEDAESVLDWLQSTDGQRPVLLLGHSEGGLVALELARKRPGIAGLVLIATPGRGPAQTVREQLQALAEPFRSSALALLTQIEAGKPVEEVPSSLLGLFRPSVQPFLRSLFMLRPAEALTSLAIPVLVIGGGNDLQVGRAEFEALVASRDDLRSRWLERMNHVMVDATADRQANLATYSDPTLPLSEGLADAVASFARDVGHFDRSPR